MLNWKDSFLRIRKYPTAVGAFVLCAVFALLLIPEQFVLNPVIIASWSLGVLMLFQIWSHFKEDHTYRVSGIIPAWLMMIAAFILLPLCPCRELSLGLIMLSVCSYSAGIIFAMKMVIPFSILLGMCGYTVFFNRLLSWALNLCCGWPAAGLLKMMGYSGSWIPPSSYCFCDFPAGSGFFKDGVFFPWEQVYGGPALTWFLLFFAFILVWEMQRTPLDQFYHYVLVFPVIGLMTVFHILLFVMTGFHFWELFFISFSFAFVIFLFAGLPLYRLSRKKTVKN